MYVFRTTVRVLLQPTIHRCTRILSKQMCTLFFYCMFICTLFFPISFLSRSHFPLKSWCFHSMPSHIYIVRSPVFFFCVLFTFVNVHVCVWTSKVALFSFQSLCFWYGFVHLFHSSGWIGVWSRLLNVTFSCLIFYYSEERFFLSLHNIPVFFFLSFLSWQISYSNNQVSVWVYANAFRFYFVTSLVRSLYTNRMQCVRQCLATQHHIAIG